MVTAATRAITSRETPTAQHDFDYSIRGGLFAELHTDNWAVSAGERILSFKLTALSPTSATVTLTTRVWQEVVNRGGTVNHLVVKGNEQLSLVRVGKRWLVNDRTASAPF